MPRLFARTFARVVASRRQRYTPALVYRHREVTPILPINPDSIRDAICFVFQCTKESLHSGARYPSLVDARHTLLWLERHLLQMSYPEMGKACSINHTTALNAVRSYPKRFRSRQVLQDKAAAVLQMLHVQQGMLALGKETYEDTSDTSNQVQRKHVQ